MSDTKEIEPLPIELYKKARRKLLCKPMFILILIT